jgi:CRP/FNR family transcriptional regulator
MSNVSALRASALTRSSQPPKAAAPANLLRAPGEAIADSLQLIEAALVPQRRVVREGDVVYRVGEAFGNLYVLNSGYCKIVNLSADGREQVVALKFRGDWLGFDGIADQQYTCDAVAIDTGEVWVIPYQALMSVCAAKPGLLTVIHEAMSREIASDRESLMSVCTLTAEARVADFLRYWAESIARRGMRTDQITLRMSRAEMGNYLGMTLETVSRSLSRLAREQLIQFAEKGRRDIRIPCVEALQGFVSRSLSPASRVLQ